MANSEHQLAENLILQKHTVCWSCNHKHASPSSMIRSISMVTFHSSKDHRPASNGVLQQADKGLTHSRKQQRNGQVTPLASRAAVTIPNSSPLHKKDSTKDATHSGELNDELKDTWTPGAASRYVTTNQQTCDVEHCNASAASRLNSSTTLRELWWTSDSSIKLDAAL